MSSLKLKISICFFLILSPIILGQKNNFLLQKQKRNLISGQIIINQSKKNREIIRITNQNTKKKSKSDANGNFSILADHDDVLVFSSAKTKTRHIKVTEDFLKGKKIIHLDLVGEFPQEITVYSLRYTGNLKKDLEIHLKNKTKLSIPPSNNPETKFSILNPLNIINLLSGKGYKEKRFQAYQQAYQKEQDFINKISEYYPEDFFIKELELSKESIAHYLEFVSKDEQAREIYKKKNFFMLRKILKSKAEIYLKAQNK